MQIINEQVYAKIIKYSEKLKAQTKSDVKGVRTERISTKGLG
jgi:hypothetical protein